MSSTSRSKSLLPALAVLSFAIGLAAAAHYYALDLTLSHYDAKAHLVVARRVLDHLTPGWKQFGAVWLPLPHLLNFLPVQVDALYRTGLSGVAISVASFTLAAVALAFVSWRITGSRLAALTTWVVVVADPNLLYLQSTPMTEPLLFGLLAASVATMLWWTASPSGATAWRPGAVIALACLTRYEAWPVAAALLASATVVLWRRAASTGTALADALASVARVTAWPVAAILLFLVNSRVSTGAWFVSDGFFVPENEALGNPAEALRQVAEGAEKLIGTWTVRLACLGVPVALWWMRRPDAHARSRAWMALALAGTAALPFYAFSQGHPFRIRYMVALLLATSVCAGLAVAVWPRRWLRAITAAAFLTLALVETPPLDAQAPMVTEAQWDRPRTAARRTVTACLLKDFERPTHKILVSMGSLAHYMQEMSRDGFRLDDFIHEGTDIIWPDALLTPHHHVEWVLFEEQAEGGDMLTQRRQRDPTFVSEFERVCESAGVALYRRRAPASDRLLP